ncbi:hypothetical protein [Amycolatopsis sp. NPDC004378]
MRLNLIGIGAGAIVGLAAFAGSAAAAEPATTQDCDWATAQSSSQVNSSTAYTTTITVAGCGNHVKVVTKSGDSAKAATAKDGAGDGTYTAGPARYVAYEIYYDDYLEESGSQG